jgi:hypothetical protein
MPFPASLDTINKLLFTYLEQVRKPDHAIFVLDTSGSMSGDRIDSLKKALLGLTGSDTSITGQFAAFRQREELTFVLFNDRVYKQADFTINNTDPNGADLARVRDFINGLQAGGGTAIYDAVYQAYTVAANAMRAVALARREEVSLMRLLAARGWMLRGPFLVEGLTSGAFAGLAAAAVVGGAWLMAERFAAATYAEVLPGVGRLAIQDLAAAIIVAGLALGSLTAWNSLRRLST